MQRNSKGQTAVYNLLSLVKDILKTTSKGCTLEKAEGECNGKYLRYYYDSTDKKCKRFSWTGCEGGNANNEHTSQNISNFLGTADKLSQTDQTCRETL
uniref:BPTI/Kunitz inhibitor domain-containing protein n=1 Tax=Pundamilia nyererei TaxID=303518 RepID=A0A3B4G5Q4_9CICH